MTDPRAPDPETTRVMDALRGVVHPESGKDLVSLGLVSRVRACDGNVAFDIDLGRSAPDVRRRVEEDARARVADLPGVKAVSVTLTASGGAAHAPHAAAPHGAPHAGSPSPGVRHMVAVASGKGGVGKSTVAVNLAVALARTGQRVGLLDADVYGPSVPIMMGTRAQPAVTSDQKIIPLEAHGVRLMSLGFLAGEETPVIWRGPIATRLIQQFLGDVAWGELDVLVIDLPPGTGDIQLTLTQSAPLAGAVIVTTPQDVALEDVRRAVRMFERVKVPILGVIENMSWFVCPACGARHEIFSHGGGEDAARRFGVPFLGEVPLEPAVREGGDAGTPVVLTEPGGASARAFASLAEKVLARLAEADSEDEPIEIIQR